MKTMNEESKILYVIKDKWGHQLSAPNSDDGELWDRVADMEGRGRTGLCVVAYTGKDMDEGIQPETTDSLTESHDDTFEFVMQIEDMIREVTPKIIDKAFGKSYSFDLDGEGSEENAMEAFREAVHELAMAIYSMVVSRRNGYDESLNEDINDAPLSTYTISDIIAWLLNNFPEDQVNDELQLFNEINKKLGVDDAVFIVDDSGIFDPDYLDFDILDDVDGDIYTVNDIKFYVEHNDNGNNVIYFKDEADAKKYVDFINKIYDEDIDEGVVDVVGAVINGIANTGAKVIDSIDKLHS